VLIQVYERLIELRKAFRLTQVQISLIIGVRQSNYSKYEKGLIEPSYSFMNILAIKCKINGNWLLTGEGDMFLPGCKYCKESRFDNQVVIRERLAQAERLRQIVGLQEKLIPST